MKAHAGVLWVACVVFAACGNVPFDAVMPQMCTLTGGDSCGDPNLTCQCCPAGGPMSHCLCAEPRATPGNCPDPSGPDCKLGLGIKPGFCARITFTCCWACA